jgi:hypothetical protein
MTYTFGDYTFPPGVAISDNFGDVVTRTQRLPGASGGLDGYGNQRAPTEIGNVQISFPLFYEWAKTTYSESNAADAMLAARDALRGLILDGTQKLTKPVGSSGARWCWARVQNVPSRENEDDHTRLLQRVQLNFQVADPRWYEIGTETSNYWGAVKWGSMVFGGGVWGGSLPTPQAISGLLTSWTHTRSSGNAETDPRIVVVAGAGGVENLRIQRLVNGIVWDEANYMGSLSSGETLEINCRAKTVKVDGVNAYADFEFATPDWFTLLPGANSLRAQMDGSGNQANVYLRYYEAYR